MSASVRSLLAQHNYKIRLLEAHDYDSCEAVRNAVGDNGQRFQGVWLSGLTQTTYLGLPDTELLSPMTRAACISKYGFSSQNSHKLCLAFDADSGGNIAEIPKTVKTLSDCGISIIIIEDKTIGLPGQKVNSLGQASRSQPQADTHDFAKVVQAFAAAAKAEDIMITARIESFTVRTVSEDDAQEEALFQSALHDALARADAYKMAGADAIMIHSKSAQPVEVMSFLENFRRRDPSTSVVVAPSTFSDTADESLHDADANIIVYANHLMRAKLQAVGDYSDHYLPNKPDVFAKNSRVAACLEARNLACLLRNLCLRKDLNEAACEYRVSAQMRAIENMRLVTESLVNGKASGAADAHIISVKDLLMINARQVTSVSDVIDGVPRGSGGQTWGRKLDGI